MNFAVGIRLSHCFTINISGDTYIEPGVPYKVTCTVSNFLENRKTIYSAVIPRDDITDFAKLTNDSGCVQINITIQKKKKKLPIRK